MKQIRTYILFSAISLSCAVLSAQEDSLSIQSKTLVTEGKAVADSLAGKQKKAGNLFVGVDLFNPALSFFTDKQGGVAVVSYRIHKKWNGVAEIGFEKNIYDDLDWNIDVNGMYFKLGFNWFVSQDYQDASNGFYTGIRFAYSLYRQTVNQYPIRLSTNQIDEYGSLPEANVSAYWVEIVGGGRIQLLGNLYADVSVRPEIYVGSKKQEGLDPLVIPGYGKDTGPINFSIFWGLTYKLF